MKRTDLVDRVVQPRRVVLVVMTGNVSNVSNVSLQIPSLGVLD